MRRITVTLSDDLDDLLRRAASGGSEAEFVRRAIIETVLRDELRGVIDDLRRRLQRIEEHLHLEE